jgi:nitrate/TMAO reductase-like tetraheme cytochrome c subunit
MANPASFRESWIRPFLFYGNNPLSLIGGAITTASAMVLIGFWVVSAFGHGGSSNPYLGIILDLILPAIFVVGLLLIPIGIAVRRSYLRATDQVPSVFPEISIHDPIFRRGIEFVLVATVINFVIVGTASYRGVAYMDTVSFCGATCHVMAPEFTAYHVSSHAGVACTECHVAPGTAGYIHAKLNGTNQLFMVLTNNYPKPIMAEDKVPVASTTCLNCHNIKAQFGEKLHITTSFADDLTNSRTTSITMLHIGGSDVLGHLSGIHGAHMGKIEYIATDTTNQTIPWVRKTNADGSITEFDATGIKPTTSGQRRTGMRTMDCIDCHNRAAHSFDTPENALNRDMEAGTPNASLPFIHKEGLALIKVDYASRQVASERISSGLITFYRSQYPAIWNTQQPQVQDAAAALVKIYGDNIFPSMNVRWGTHPNNIGHNDSPGCFRCHDGNHTSTPTAKAAATTITNDCSTCHNLVVMNDPHPKLLTDLGIQQ